MNRGEDGARTKVDESRHLVRLLVEEDISRDYHGAGCFVSRTENQPTMHLPRKTLTQFGIDQNTLFRVNTTIDKLALDVGAKECIDAYSKRLYGSLSLDLALLGLHQLVL